MQDLFIESGHASVNHQGESLCGDYISVNKRGEQLTAVLSDGLGSGVKANILSTLTATIFSTLVSHNRPIDECIETVASTLPMCKERKVAYSTFTMVQITGAQARLVQYDNPHAILLRGGRNFEYPYNVRFVGPKEIHESTLTLQENDVLILMSDGVTSSGLGKLTDNGWPREEIISCMERIYSPELSAQHIAAEILNGCMALCQDLPDDDTTALVFKVRRRRAVNVMIGPPVNPGDDEKVLKLFFAKEGLHVVCGGTTAQIASRYLKKPVVPVEDSGTAISPMIAKIDGVDLVTEGVITLQKVTELAEHYGDDSKISLHLSEGKDGVSLLAALLLEQATDINIFYGQAVNTANEGPDVDSDTKDLLVDRLCKALGAQGKNVRVSRC